MPRLQPLLLQIFADGDQPVTEFGAPDKLCMFCVQHEGQASLLTAGVVTLSCRG